MSTTSTIALPIPPRESSPVHVSPSPDSSPVDLLTQYPSDAEVSFYVKEEDEDEQEQEQDAPDTQETIQDQGSQGLPVNSILPPSLCHQMNAQSRNPRGATVSFDDDVRVIETPASPSSTATEASSQVPTYHTRTVERYKDVQPFSRDVTCGMLQQHLSFLLAQIDHLYSKYFAATTQEERNHWATELCRHQEYTNRIYRNLAVFLTVPQVPLDPHIAELSKAIQMKLNNPLAHLGLELGQVMERGDVESLPPSVTTAPEKRITRAIAKRHNPLGNKMK